MDDPLFPTTYLASRERFRRSLGLVQQRWPAARLETYPLPGDPDGLSIDWISTPATTSPQKLLVFTTGEHGAEGFAGSAMLQLLVQESLPRLDPALTGLLLVHAINPWGMHNLRRTNRENVDLNRNFVWDTAALDPAFNPDYARLAGLLAPRRELRRADRWTFYPRALRAVLKYGAGGLRTAALLGQYGQPQGIYYGGETLQAETRALIGLYRAWYAAYAQILHLDMHTGYGPRYQMSIVNSALEPASSSQHQQRFAYPSVVKSNPDEFYAINGDMIDYVYTLVQRELPDRRLYATCFEFGTLGDSTPAGLRALRASVLENQAHWHGASNPALQKWVQSELRELFFPQEQAWQDKAVQDFRQAAGGILKAEGYIA